MIWILKISGTRRDFIPPLFQLYNSFCATTTYKMWVRKLWATPGMQKTTMWETKFCVDEWKWPTLKSLRVQLKWGWSVVTRQIKPTNQASILIWKDTNVFDRNILLILGCSPVLTHLTCRLIQLEREHKKQYTTLFVFESRVLQEAWLCMILHFLRVNVMVWSPFEQIFLEKRIEFSVVTR